MEATNPQFCSKLGRGDSIESALPKLNKAGLASFDFEDSVLIMNITLGFPGWLMTLRQYMTNYNAQSPVRTASLTRMPLSFVQMPNEARI